VAVLGTADVRRIAPAVSRPSDDRAPEWVARGTPEPLRGDLIDLLGRDRVLTRAIDIVRYASDASPYRLFPKAVVIAHDADEIAKVLAYARRTATPVIFRAGGTSLSGQAQGDGILIDVRREWAGVEVLEDGLLARVRPGTVLGHVNRVLAPYGRKLGPDPASTDIATAGGVIANNSGGMRCGVVHDSYRTLRSLKFVLPSGTAIDTADPDAATRFAKAEPRLARGLAEIREEILADEALAGRIRRKFEIKNTTGYRLCAFLDAEEPVDIFRRLLVGSEGTLAFIAEAVFETIPVGRHTTVSFVHFTGIDAASAVVPALVEAGASAVELMVAPALIVASHSIPGTPEAWRELPVESAALLIEFRSDDEADLDGLEARAREALSGHDLLAPPVFHRDRETIEIYWTVREGLHGLVGKLRPQGTALIMEDVCVRPERVAESANDLRALLGKHGFLPGVAGHASAGNLHFMLTPAFDKPEDRDRYEAFMTELVELIVDKYDGSLKSEHGTGRNMAPYVEREWGAKATELMWRIKGLADPDGVLGPDVVLTRDAGVHLRDLKSTPPIEEVADTCVECGFCEPVCPSRLITTTPRQRIVVRREMARQPAGSAVQRSLLEQYEYDAIQTCAADGTCMLVCPLGIDAGKLIKELRGAQHTAGAERVALGLAKRWGAVEKAARGGLRVGEAISRVAGDGPMRGTTRALRRAVSRELVPEWAPGMPPAAPPRLPSTRRAGAAAVYLPSCVNRMLGPARKENGSGTSGRSVPEALVEISRRAGLDVWIPDDVPGHCCATPWASKGYERGNEYMANKTLESLWRWSSEGKLPVVSCATSCTLGLAADVLPSLNEENRERHERLEILDAVTWVGERLLPKLEVRGKVESATLHPPCAMRHLGLVGELEALAGELAREVVVPPTATCCGFAGDRGFLHPELTEAATRLEAAEVAERPTDAYLCGNRTCEIGLQRATGAPYESFVHLVDELTAG
jgi:D-lactate dehydrogenase